MIANILNAVIQITLLTIGVGVIWFLGIKLKSLMPTKDKKETLKETPKK